jgi:hypothetical protein
MCGVIEATYERLLGLPARPRRPATPPDALVADDGTERVRTLAGATSSPAPGSNARSNGHSSGDGRGVTADRNGGSDERALNWRFVVPSEPPGMLLLPTNGERLSGALVANRTPDALSAALSNRYPAVAAPDLSSWVGATRDGDNARRFLDRLARSVSPGGWIYAGFANPYSPLRPLQRGALSRRTATRTLRDAGFTEMRVYVPFPDQRLPAYLVSAGRDAELDYFVRNLSFPYVDDASGLRGRARRAIRTLLQRCAAALPTTISARVVPSFAIVARRRA